MFLITFSDFHRFDLIVSPPIAQINGERDDLEKSSAQFKIMMIFCRFLEQSFYFMWQRLKMKRNTLPFFFVIYCVVSFHIVQNILVFYFPKHFDNV